MSKVTRQDQSARRVSFAISAGTEAAIAAICQASPKFFGRREQVWLRQIFSESVAALARRLAENQGCISLPLRFDVTENAVGLLTDFEAEAAAEKAISDAAIEAVLKAAMQDPPCESS